MSFEGFYVRLCENGHISTCGCYDQDAEQPCCCGAGWRRQFTVDETNGYESQSDPRYNGELVLVAEPKTETCNLGHAHVLEPARYAIKGDPEVGGDA